MAPATNSPKPNHRGGWRRTKKLPAPSKVRDTIEVQRRSKVRDTLQVPASVDHDQDHSVTDDDHGGVIRF